MTLKKSKFNVLISLNEEETIIFNTFSGAIGKFNAETMRKYNSEKFQDLFSTEELALLQKKRILVPVEEDENKAIHDDRVEGIIQTKSKFIRIWTTSGCNARCYYCFENGIEHKTMNIETADNLLHFVNNWMQEGDELRIEWFGGEPLLNVDIIDYLTSGFDTIVDKKKGSIRSSMVTNGSLIDESIARKMKEKWHISSTQITLDGYGEEYDKTKNYKSNKYNFFRVIDNIKTLLSFNVRVVIRMNYDNKNFDTLVSLIEFLHREFQSLRNISYYLYPVWSSLDNTFQSTAIADSKLITLYDMLIDKNMAEVRQLARLNYRKHQCRACSEQGYNIFPDGSIGKCAEIYNQTIGNIVDGITDKEVYRVWTSKELDSKCNDCIYLPLCQGGCKSSVYNPKMPQCFPNKDIIEDIIKWYVTKLDQV